MEYVQKYKMRIYSAEEIEERVNDLSSDSGMELLSITPWRTKVLENVQEITHYLVTFIKETSLYDT